MSKTNGIQTMANLEATSKAHILPFGCDCRRLDAGTSSERRSDASVFLSLRITDVDDNDARQATVSTGGEKQSGRACIASSDSREHVPAHYRIQSPTVLISHYSSSNHEHSTGPSVD